MILTDREIQIAIERGLITVDPAPVNRAFSSTSLDLTLDANIRRFKKDASFLARTIEPAHPEYTIDAALQELTEDQVIDARDGFVLPPNELVLAWTREYVSLFTSTRIAARIEGKSSFARIGLAIHMTAPTIHAGLSPADRSAAPHPSWDSPGIISGKVSSGFAQPGPGMGMAGSQPILSLPDHNS